LPDSPAPRPARKECAMAAPQKTPKHPLKEAAHAPPPHRRENGPAQAIRDGAGVRPREDLDRFRVLFENAPIGVYRTTPDGRVEYANVAITRMLGFDSFEELAQRVLEQEGFFRLHPRRQFQERIERDGAVRNLETAWRRKDGTPILVRESAVVVRDAAGCVRCCEGVVEEISTTAQMEKAVMATGEGIRFVLDEPSEAHGPSGKKAERVLRIAQRELEMRVRRRTAELAAANEWLRREVAQRHEVEATLRWEAAMNAAVARLSELLIRTDSIEDASSLGLESAKELTGSAYGFVGYIDPAQGWLIAPTMTRDVWEDCKLVEKSCVFKTFTGLWGWVLLNRRSILSNDPQHDSRSSGCPPGHVPIHRMVCAPAVLGQTVVGEVAVANARVDYTQRDLAAIERLAALWALAIRHMRSQESIRQSEERFRLVALATRDAIYDWDLRAESCWWTGRHQTLLEQVVSPGTAAWKERLHAADRARVSAELSRFLDGPEDYWKAEYRMLRADGTHGFIVDQGFLIRDGQGRPLRMIGTLTDATDRKAAEEALRESEQRYRLIADASSEVFWASDKDRATVFSVNRAFEDVWGRRRESLRATPSVWLDAVHPDDQARVRAAWSARAAGQTCKVEYRVVRPDGSVRHVWDRGFPIQTIGGQVERIVGVATDVTELKEAQEALRQNRDLLQTIIESTRDVVVMKDRDGRYTLMNPAGLALARKRADEVIGKTDEDLFSVADARRLRAQDKMVMETGQSIVGDETFGIAGIPRHFLRHKLPYRDAPGRIVGVISISTDITDFKHAQDRLRRAERLASIGTMAAGIAHELNNPIGGILLAAQNAKRALGQPTAKQVVPTCLSDIVDNAERCGQIIRNVLRLARQEASAKELLDVSVAVRRAVLQTEELAYGRRSTVDLDLPAGLPKARGNPIELEQVFSNLIRNSIEAGGEGTRIRVSIREVAGRDLRITVEDDGRGIPPNQADRLFDPFFTTRRTEGSAGLGLSSVHSIISDHGGAVDVQSRPGGGTTVIVELPGLEPTS